MTHRKALYLSLITSAVLAACGGGGDDGGTPMPVAVGDTVALTASGKIVSFERAAPGTLVSRIALSGLQSGETLVGIDVRPASGVLYAVSNQGRIYTVEPGTGMATLRATLSGDASDSTSPFTALAGTSFGMDFNPVVDRLRLVSNTGQNLRINVDTGATTTDGAINGAAATVIASAYTNAFAGTTSTQLFNLDSSTGSVFLQNPPNDGTLTAAIPLGISFTAVGGFDIDGKTQKAYAALQVGGNPQLYTVPLAAGTAPVLVGTIGTGEAVTALALRPAANPTVLVLTLDNQLAAFMPSAPNTLTRSTPISGLGAGERVLGIDFRPSTGKLYGLTTLARLVVIDPDTAVASSPVALAADPADVTAPYAGLEAGSSFVVDFNPVADRLRVVTDTGLNLRINVDTGATTTDGRINRSTPPVVVAGAYTNSFAGATSTALYDLDAVSDVLALQSPPNDGTLADVGAVGLDLSGQNAMDIAGGGNGLVLAALRAGTSGPFTLYTVSLTTGAATLYANTTGDASRSLIGGATGPVVTDLAIRY